MTINEIYNTTCGNPTRATIRERMNRVYFLTAAIEMLSEAGVDSTVGTKLAGYDTEDMLNAIGVIAWELSSEIASVTNVFDEEHEI